MVPKKLSHIKISTSINHTKSPNKRKGTNLDSNMDGLRTDGNLKNSEGIIFPHKHYAYRITNNTRLKIALETKIFYKTLMVRYSNF